MYRFLNKKLLSKFRRQASYCTSSSESFQFDHDLKGEIVESHLSKIFMLGINKPDEKNLLDDGSLKILHQSIEKFDSNDQFSVLVLHGIGGNFCTGIRDGTNRIYPEDILKEFGKLKKPTVACLTGYTNGFGFQLAMMSDFRFAEENALIGLGLKSKQEGLLPIVCERLVAITGVSTALEVALKGTSMNSQIALNRGIVNYCSEVGAGLGSAVNFAFGLAKYPLEDLIEQKKQVLMYGGIRTSR